VAAIAPETKQAVDFFGRAIIAKPLTASQEAGMLVFQAIRRDSSDCKADVISTDS